MENEIIELKPCPFCGSAGKYTESQALTCKVIKVGCSNQHCWLKPLEGLMGAKTVKAKIIKAWNTRKG